VTCTWDVDRRCLPPLPDPDDDGYQAAADRQNTAVDTAVMVLYQLTGQQFGQCPLTVRPCPIRDYGRGYNVRPWSQTLLYWDGSHWFNGNCGCRGRCSRTGPGIVHLPGPVGSITAVTIADEVLDPSEYVAEGNYLYRRGGRSWPSQDLGRPLGETGTWSVDYLRGLPQPAGADVMAGSLALEFINACEGGDCRIPRSVVSISRQGVNHVFDATKMLASGKTGLENIDLWINAINPYHLLQAPSVI